jgi:hypothetical protein
VANRGGKHSQKIIKDKVRKALEEIENERLVEGKR